MLTLRCCFALAFQRLPSDVSKRSRQPSFISSPFCFVPYKQRRSAKQITALVFKNAIALVARPNQPLRLDRVLLG